MAGAMALATMSSGTLRISVHADDPDEAADEAAVPDEADAPEQRLQNAVCTVFQFSIM